MQHALTQSILPAEGGKKKQLPFAKLTSRKLYPRSTINYAEKMQMVKGSQTRVVVYIIHNNNNDNNNT
jgi:hypothetical protein